MSTKPKKEKLSTARPVMGTCTNNGSILEFDKLSDVEQDGFSMGHVSACCRGKRNSHKGYTWKYLPTPSKREQLLAPEQYPVPIISLSDDLITGIFLCKDCNSDYQARVDSVRQGFSIRCCECSIAEKVGYKATKPRLYSIWTNMKTRCYNRDSASYQNYGSRGITVCDEWYTSIETFILWAEENGYSENLTIDRMDNNKGYFPDNCRWVTAEVQARNTRKLMSTNTSGYRGVSWNTTAKKWQADICIQNKTKYLGVYMNKIEAAKAYDNYIIKNRLEHTKNFTGPEETIRAIYEGRASTA